MSLPERRPSIIAEIIISAVEDDINFRNLWGGYDRYETGNGERRRQQSWYLADLSNTIAMKNRTSDWYQIVTEKSCSDHHKERKSHLAGSHNGSWSCWYQKLFTSHRKIGRLPAPCTLPHIDHQTQEECIWSTSIPAKQGTNIHRVTLCHWLLLEISLRSRGLEKQSSYLLF